jgi:alpha-1,2-mannosyltransferase
VFVLLALAALGYWAWRVTADRDLRLGLALTGALACLVSPITWVHHLVWLGPALVLLFEARAWGWLALTYGTLCSRVVWRFNGAHPGGLGLLGADAYLVAAVVLLAVTRPAAVTARDDPAAT